MALPQLPSDTDLLLRTKRLILEPVIVEHAEELCKLFSDPALHIFVPFEVPTLEDQIKRCGRWAQRISPKGDELWLNWVARLKDSDEVIGHFQAGVKAEDEASIGYLIGRTWQGQGYATEAFQAVLLLLKDRLFVRRVRAWIDTRNAVSLQLVERLGFRKSEFIKDADFFKGATSDEWVYEQILR